jgi:hypothetical protein
MRAGHHQRRPDHDAFLGVKRAVSDQGIGLQRRQQAVGTAEIMCLSRVSGQLNRIAERVNDRSDLAAQPTARTADRLVRTSSFFARRRRADGAINDHVFICRHRLPSQISGSLI